VTNTDIELGDLVRDRITDHEGIVGATDEYLSGYRRVILVSKRETLSLGRGKDAFDVEDLRVIEKRKVEPTPIKSHSDVELGDEVQDTVTDFSGVAYIRRESISGCLTFFVQPRGLHEGKILPMAAIDAFSPKGHEKENGRAKTSCCNDGASS